MSKTQETERPILVPVDFSPSSAAALVWAAKFAERLGSSLRVLHVVHDPESDPGYYSGSTGSDELKRIEESAAEMMTKFLAEVAEADRDVGALQSLEPILIPGIPVTRILEVAQRVNASMIVIGSHGRTGLTRLLLGSKAERVSQLSPLPVTIVKSPREQDGE